MRKKGEDNKSRKEHWKRKFIRTERKIREFKKEKELKRRMSDMINGMN